MSLNYFKNLATSAASSISQYANSFQFKDKEFFKEQEMTDQHIIDKLASQYESDTYDGLKQIIAMMLADKDISRFFPHVVIIMHKSSSDLKRLAYVILSQTYAQNKNNALMPINILHKETVVKEPNRRGDALRILTDFSLNEVYPFLYDLVKKCVLDPNPYVRKISFIGLYKIIQQTDFQIEDHYEEIQQLISKGLKDIHHMVFTQALIIGSIIFPIKEFLNLLHPTFLRIAETLDQFDPQVLPHVCYIVAQYASYYLVSSNTENDYILLMKHIQSSFQVTMTAEATLSLVNLYLYLKSSQTKLEAADIEKMMPLLERSLSDFYFNKYCALDTIFIIYSIHGKSVPKPSKNLLERIKLKQNEPNDVKTKKLQILQLIFNIYQCEISLSELLNQVRNPKKQIRIEAIKLLGECGRLLTQTKNEADENTNESKCIGTILQSLIQLLKQKDDQVMTESIIALQKMIVKDSEQSHAIILYCIKILDKIQSGRAKATMIYLLQEFIERFPSLSKETFRRLVKGYISEQDEQVKLQILNLGCKVVVKNKEDKKVKEIFQYLMKVASYDKSLIIRQKVRVLQHLFDDDNQIDTAALFLNKEEAKTDSLTAEEAKDNAQKNLIDLLNIGSFSRILNHLPCTKQKEFYEFMSSQRATEEERVQARVLRQQQQVLNQSSESGGSQEKSGYIQKPIMSISSEQFKSSNEAMKSNDQQNYKKSHFTVKDKDSLKQDYEDFFQQQEESAAKNDGAPSQNDENPMSLGSSPGKKDVSKPANKKSLEDEYEYYDEDDSQQNQ